MYCSLKLGLSCHAPQTSPDLLKPNMVPMQGPHSTILALTLCYSSHTMQCSGNIHLHTMACLFTCYVTCCYDCCTAMFKGLLSGLADDHSPDADMDDAEGPEEATQSELKHQALKGAARSCSAIVLPTAQCAYRVCHVLLQLVTASSWHSAIPATCVMHPTTQIQLVQPASCI